VEPVALNPYLPVAISLVIAVVFSLAFVGLSKFFGPQRPTATKESLYECGMPSIGPAHQRFTVKFYLVAVLFILFDLEAVFLFPWSVVYQELMDSVGILYALVEMVFFLGTLFLGWLYCWKRGALEWD
jgi:NADH-quinone oxidoreductase subunit A